MTETLEDIGNREYLKIKLEARIGETLRAITTINLQISKLDTIMRDWLNDNYVELTDSAEVGKLKRAKNTQVFQCSDGMNRVRTLVNSRKDTVEYVMNYATDYAPSIQKLEYIIENLEGLMKELAIALEIVTVNIQRFEEIIPCGDLNLVERMGKAANKHIELQDIKFGTSYVANQNLRVKLYDRSS